MEVEIIGNKQAAEEILQLTELWDQSLENQDLDGLTNGYSSEISSFDIGCSGQVKPDTGLGFYAA